MLRSLAILAVVTTMFGQSVSDPYRWLEDAHSARTSSWIDAQNARADRFFAEYHYGSRIAKRIETLALTGVQQMSPQIAGNTLLYMREVPPAPQPVLMAQSLPNGTPEVVLDPKTLGADVSIDEVWPAPDGHTIALGTAAGGSERTTIRVVDTTGARRYSEALGPAGGGTTNPVVAWDADSKGFTYGRLPNGSQFNIALYHHVLGSPMSADRLVQPPLSPVAEYVMVSSSDATQTAALVQFGDGSPYRVYRRDGQTWRSVVGPAPYITAATFVGGKLYAIASGSAPHGQVVALGDDGTMQTIVPEEQLWALQSIAPLRDGFLLVKCWGPDWRVDQYDAKGAFVRTVALPKSGIGIGSIASSDRSDSAIIEYNGWAGPADRWVRYDARTGSLAQIYDLRVSSQQYRDVVVRRVDATSADGTKVPVTYLALKSTPLDGKAPTILTAYGGFDLPTQPEFIGPYLAWLQMGGVYAVANIRGGSEFGEGWHQDGKLQRKQHVFDDFYASAQALSSAHVTNPSRLGIVGGSNGGLLMGASLVQHPAAYRAVVSYAGIYDMLRHHVFANGTYNVSEYGSTDDPSQFAALYAYSPYHHVTSASYPAVLLVTSENDPRVAAWQSWKFGAALEAANRSSHPILVYTHRTGGHGHGETFAQRVGNTALGLSFFAEQLGADAARL